MWKLIGFIVAFLFGIIVMVFDIANHDAIFVPLMLAYLGMIFILYTEQKK